MKLSTVGMVTMAALTLGFAGAAVVAWWHGWYGGVALWLFLTGGGVNGIWRLLEEGGP